MIIWKIQIRKRFRITLFITTNHNIRIFGVIPLVKLQNYKSTTVKNSEKWNVELGHCFWVELCCFRVQCSDDPVKGSTWQITLCTYFAYWSMWIFISGLPSTHSSGAVWESRWPSGLSVLTSLLVSVDVNLYWTMLRHWSQLVPNTSTDIWGH